MWKSKAIAAAAALGLLSVGVYPSAAKAEAYPSSSFYVSYGNTVARGTVTWYNRSIGVSYSFKTASGSGCWTLWVEAYNPTPSDAAFGLGSIVCNGNSISEGFSVGNSGPGGYNVASVRIVDDTGTPKRGDICEIDFTYCIDDDF
jgi:hypothetical protein